MDRRKKCGTCRFFKDADMAGSGWCRHPKRGKLHDLVLVRKEELACRNSWDQDLWEPPGEHPRAQDAPSQAADQPTPGGGFNRPVMPAGDSATGGVSNATDRVTEIAVPIERPRPPMPMARRWTSATRAQQDFDLPGIGTTGTIDEERERNGDERPVKSAGKAEPVRRVTELDENAPSDSDRWRTADPYEARLTANVPTPSIPDAARDRATRAVRETPYSGSRVSRRQMTEYVQESPIQPVMGAAGSGRTEPLPIDELNKAMEEIDSPIDRAQPSIQPGISLPGMEETQRYGEAHETQVPALTPDRRNEGAPHVHVDGVDLGSGQNAEFRRPAKRPVDNTPEPIDRVTWISGIARCCGNCRDFRRGPDGKTGVCTNSYAFQEQPVVQSDQLACGAGRGEWWLPHDEFWLERADTSHHTRPTPYLDAALAERQALPSEHGRESLDGDDYRVGR